MQRLGFENLGPRESHCCRFSRHASIQTNECSEEEALSEVIQSLGFRHGVRFGDN